MRASVFYRIASVLLMLFAAGHTFGFRQSNPAWGTDAVLGLMRSVHFDALAFNRTYWDFFSGFGFIFSAFLVLGGFGLATEPIDARDPGAHPPYHMEPRGLLRRDHCLEL